MPLDFIFAAKAIGTPIAEFLLKHFSARQRRPWVRG